MTPGVYRPVAKPLSSARKSYESSSHILLASVASDGKVKFLNLAWETVADFRPQEMRCRPLREIIPLDDEAAQIVIGILLDRNCFAPLEMAVCGGTGKVTRVLWHRRYDPDDQRMYLAGEEIPAPHLVRSEAGSGVQNDWWHDVAA